MHKFETIGDISQTVLAPFVQEKDKRQDWLYHPFYYGLYFDIGRKVKPRGIAEIGVRFGYSALSMILGSECDPDFVGFDAEFYETSNDIATASIKSATKGSCTISKVDTRKVNSLQVPDGFMADIIHVDGDHEVDGLLHDLNLVLPMANDRSIIIVDDTTHFPLLAQPTDDFAAANGWKVDTYDSLRGTKILYRD